MLLYHGIFKKYVEKFREVLEMANLNKLFLEYGENIILSKKEKDTITTGRDALRNKIKKNFKDNDRSEPKFCTQGSFIMNTTILQKIGQEYDLDNGVYLQGYSNNIAEWPSTYTVHKWIKDAVDNHTKMPPIDKNTCVRVVYTDGYHIDLPSYIVREEELEDGTTEKVAYLAHKTKGWIVSDPKAFTAWFRKKVKENGEQLRRMVKYLKGWKDNKEIDLKGISITILVGNHFSAEDQRDDIALLKTVTNIIDELEDDFNCYKPVIPTDEDLFDGMSETKKNSILNGLNSLKKKLDKAINEVENEKDAANELKKIFGDKFPEGEDIVRSKLSYVSTVTPTLLDKGNHHFA